MPDLRTKMLRSSTASSPRKWHGVAICYWAEACGDGLGAQAQRLMGIFCAAQVLNIRYLHRQIRSIELNPGDPHEDLDARQDYLARVNQMFDLPSSVSGIASVNLRMKTLTPRKARVLKTIDRIAKLFRVGVLVEIESASPLLEPDPGLYHLAASHVSARIPARRSSTSFTIDVHIRRALAPQFGKGGRPYDRFVSTEWYREILTFVIDELTASDRAFAVRVHTDVPRNRWKVPSDTSTGTLAMWNHHGLVDSEGFLAALGEDIFREMEGVAEIEWAQEWDPLDALESMVNADLLIIYASSLSYVAGLLRMQRPTVSPTFYHATPQDWCTLGPHLGAKDLISLKKFLTKIRLGTVREEE